MTCHIPCGLLKKKSLFMLDLILVDWLVVLFYGVSTLFGSFNVE